MKKKKIKINKNTKITNLLNNYPELIEFFLKKGLNCFYCPFASIETLRDICKIYSISWKDFKKEIIDFLKKKK